MPSNTLSYLCTRWICNNFEQVQQLSPSNFTSLPEDVKDKLLAHMLQTKKLNSNNLRPFLSNTLRHLSLDEGGQLERACYEQVALHCPQLVSLSLAGCTTLGPKELQSILVACPTLSAISLRECYQLDDQALHAIAAKPGPLVYLDLFKLAKITTKGVVHLAQAPCSQSLEFISLGQCPKISSAALDALALLPSLIELNLSTCPLLSSNAMVPLTTGPAANSLRALDLSHCGNILDPGLAQVAKLTQLRTLQLSGMLKISAEGVYSIARSCVLLETLSLNKCTQLTDDAVKALFTCKSLTMVDISFLEQVTDAAFEDMPMQPSLVSLVMIKVTRITDVAVKTIARAAPNLKVWNLWKCVNITDDGITAIGQNNHLLTHIQLSECSRITDRGVKELAIGCTLLSTVILGGWATITDEGIKILTKHCKFIRTIDLGGLISITNHSLRYLGESCPNLFAVSLFDCKSVTAEGVHSLVGAAPTLQRLDMGGKSGVTPQEVAQIASKYKNRYLDVAF